MNIKDLKEFLATLPEEFDNYILVNGEYGSPSEPMDGDGVYFRLDKPVERMFVSEADKILCLLNQSDEEVKKHIGTDELIEDGDIEEYSIGEAIKDIISDDKIKSED